MKINKPFRIRIYICTSFLTLCQHFESVHSSVRLSSIHLLTLNILSSPLKQLHVKENGNKLSRKHLREVFHTICPFCPDGQSRCYWLTQFSKIFSSETTLPNASHWTGYIFEWSFIKFSHLLRSDYKNDTCVQSFFPWSVDITKIPFSPDMALTKWNEAWQEALLRGYWPTFRITPS